MGNTVPKLIIGTTTVISTSITPARGRAERHRAAQVFERDDDMEITQLPPSHPVDELERCVELELGLPRRIFGEWIPKASDDLEAGTDQSPETLSS